MIDWNSAEAREALRLAQIQKPRNVTDLQAAELMLIAKESLWYFQLGRWLETPPEVLAEASKPVFSIACKILMDIVDAGWKMPEEKGEAMTAIIVLMDFGEMLHTLRDRFNYLIPASFDVVLDIVLGVRWEWRYERTKRHLSGRAKHGRQVQS